MEREVNVLSKDGIKRTFFLNHMSKQTKQSMCQRKV